MGRGEMRCISHKIISGGDNGRVVLVLVVEHGLTKRDPLRTFPLLSSQRFRPSLRPGAASTIRFYSAFFSPPPCSRTHAPAIPARALFPSPHNERPPSARCAQQKPQSWVRGPVCPAAVRSTSVRRHEVTNSWLTTMLVAPKKKEQKMSLGDFLGDQCMHPPASTATATGRKVTDDI